MVMTMPILFSWAYYTHKDILMTSPTTMQCKDNTIVLARLIHRKYIKVEFPYNVEACKIVDYFNMPDEEFQKYKVRKH